MRVLLTGATGFIGSHIARQLLKQGHEVYATVRPESSHWRIQDIAGALNLVPCDVLAPESLEAPLREIRPELCIHAAWLMSRGLSAPEQLDHTIAGMRLAQRLAGLGCRRFLGIGSCFEYDTRHGWLSESSPLAPGTVYGAMKHSLHVALEGMAGVWEMEVAWVRVFNQYGPFEDERRLAPSVITSLLRGEIVRVTPGEQVRDYLHVEDTAEAICAVAASPNSGTLNVASGRPVRVKDIAEALGAIVGRPELIRLGALPSPPGDPPFICADTRRLRQQTNWNPRYDLEEGLRATVSWWQERMGAG